MSTKPPAIVFYAGDWLRDADLARCSKAAAGVWVYMIALSLQCEEPGVFRTNGVPWSERELARAICGDFRINLRSLRELILNRVAKVSDDGAIYCKRVVEDHKKLKKARENGKKGGNPLLKNQPKQPTPPLTLAGARSVAIAFASKPKAAAVTKNSPRDPLRKPGVDKPAAADQDRESQSQAINRLAHQFELAANSDHLTEPDRYIFKQVAALVINGHIDRQTADISAEKAGKAKSNKPGMFYKLCSDYVGGKYRFTELLKGIGYGKG